MHTGHYSNIKLHTDKNGKRIVKEISLPSEMQPTELIRLIKLQRDLLSAAGVPISELVSIEPLGDKQIRIIENFAGLDFQDVVSDSNLMMYLDHLFTQVYLPLLTKVKSRGEFLNAGIDTVMRNFVYNSEIGKFVYVDFMPPKVRFGNKLVQEIPEIDNADFYEIRKYGHNHPAGIIYVSYINLVRIFPNQQRLIAARLEHFLAKNNLLELAKFWHSSPVYRLSNYTAAQEVVKRIENWKFPHYYWLRELANWLRSHNPDFAKFHKEIYILTHHIEDTNSQFYGQISPKNFQRTISIISDEITRKLNKDGASSKRNSDT